MVRLTRLNHAPIVLNSDLIEHVDITPDTVIVMTSGQVFRVLETADEVITRIVQFRRRILERLDGGRSDGDAARSAETPGPQSEA